MTTVAYLLSGTLLGPDGPLECEGITFGADDVSTRTTLALPTTRATAAPCA